jgi:hypothetical protein
MLMRSRCVGVYAFVLCSNTFHAFENAHRRAFERTLRIQHLPTILCCWCTRRNGRVRGIIMTRRVVGRGEKHPKLIIEKNIRVLYQNVILGVWEQEQSAEVCAYKRWLSSNVRNYNNNR